ncbi:MAG: hypothetical protein RIG26_19270 [Thalassospira sp.]|uniref:hypothetical protein n=1 Tax=Thalassospira sp. TaxID=1912094 RepID=UPI0032EBC1E5
MDWRCTVMLRTDYIPHHMDSRPNRAMPHKDSPQHKDWRHRMDYTPRMGSHHKVTRRTGYTLPHMDFRPNTAMPHKDSLQHRDWLHRMDCMLHTGSHHKVTPRTGYIQPRTGSRHTGLPHRGSHRKDWRHRDLPHMD